MPLCRIRCAPDVNGHGLLFRNLVVSLLQAQPVGAPPQDEFLRGHGHPPRFLFGQFKDNKQPGRLCSGPQVVVILHRQSKGQFAGQRTAELNRRLHISELPPPGRRMTRSPGEAVGGPRQLRHACIVTNKEPEHETVARLPPVLQAPARGPKPSPAAPSIATASSGPSTTWSPKLRALIPPDYSDWVVIDEVQRIPELLNEAHDLIESRGLRFALTGSSARPLRRKRRESAWRPGAHALHASAHSH